jgi:hypothetical protein
MKKLLSIIVIIIVLSISAKASNPLDTSNQMKDVFPLRIGNIWKYSYLQSASIHEFSAPPQYNSSSSDSGYLSYFVLDSVKLIDTLRWTIRLIRSLHHYNCCTPDTNYWIKDTSKFYIYEILIGNHQIIADGNPLWRFPRYIVELYRFQIVDSNGYATHTPISSLDYPPYQYKLRRDTGLTYGGYSFATNTYSNDLKAYLTSSILTNVSNPALEFPNLVSPFLYPNYPNPFNSSTVITFQLSIPSRATIKIINILGQEISTILDGFFSEGSHQVYWNASNLSSGLYFIQLSTGKFSITNKCIIIR